MPIEPALHETGYGARYHLAPIKDIVAFCWVQVRCKALIQYTTPFVSVNLHTMALAFGTDIG